MGKRFVSIISFLLAAAIASLASARIIPTRPGPGAIPLPYQIPDASGTTWQIYQMGWLQQQGNTPVYAQGAMLQINNAQPNMRNNQARLDDKTGEIVFESMQAGQVQVTRRILVNKEENYVRYLDILKNMQNQDQTITVQLSTSLNYGVTSSEMIPDPRKKEQSIGWTAQTGGAKCAVEIFSGKGTKNPFAINYQQGNNSVQATLSLTIPAGKEVGLVHIHGVCDSTDAGIRLAQNLKEFRILATLPTDLRKIVVNYPAAQGFIGDREIIRGELFDVVEIRGGDQMKGTLKEPTWKLTTFYGNIELPAARIVAMFNVGDFRPRQLLVTSDGEVFGGKLAGETIALELTSGQTTQIPLSQITRLGYRKRPGEPEEWTFDKPFVALRSGDRMSVQLPAAPLEVVTRYGTLKLDPKSIATIAFQTDEHGVHEIYLADGSKFAGLVRAAGGGDDFDMKLASDQLVKFPASSVARIQFTGPPQDVDESSSPTLALANEDLLVGALSGSMKLDTAFDTITINAGEIRRLNRAKDAGLDVQVTLWDSSVLSGQLQDPVLKCQLNSGVSVAVPVSLIQEYNQPQPQPAAGMVEKIKAAVAQLNADDWKQRDKAEAELTTMGNAVVGVLKKLRPSQPPEAQQRIDQILAAVTQKKEK